MPQSKEDKEYHKDFTYAHHFSVTAENLRDYTESGYLTNTIIECCAENEFEVYSRAVYKALEEMIKERGRDAKGVYSQEARDALDNLYRGYYAQFADSGEQKIELKDRPKNIFQRFYHSFKEAKDSLKAGVQKFFSPFSGIKNIFEKKKSVKAPQKKTKVFAFEKPRGLKYYLGTVAASAFLFLGLKGDAFSSVKKTQNEAKENKTEVKKNASETSQSNQKASVLSVEELKQLLQKNQQMKKKTVQKTNIEPDPKSSNKTEKSSVEKIKENKTNYQKSQAASRGQTQDSNGQKLSFHESRLNKFLGQQGAQELCNKVKSKCPQMTQEEINFVAYGYVMNEKYALGTDNPICQALASARPLTKAEQATLSQYVKEKIGSRGQFAQKRAQEITAKRLERKVKPSQISQENKQENNKNLIESVSQDSVSQNAVSQSQSRSVSSDSSSVGRSNVEVTPPPSSKKMTKAEKRAQKKAQAKARKREKEIQRALKKAAKRKALEKKAAKEKAEQTAQKIREAKEAALRRAQEQGKNFSLAQLRHMKESIRRIS